MGGFTEAWQVQFGFGLVPCTHCGLGQEKHTRWKATKLYLFPVCSSVLTASSSYARLNSEKHSTSKSYFRACNMHFARCALLNT